MNAPKLRFKEFNDEWKTTNLATIAKFSQGLQVDVDYQSEDFDESKVRFIRIVDITTNTNDIRYIKKPDSQNYYVNKDDIFMVRYGASAGTVGWKMEGVIANNLFKIGLDDNILNAFIYYFLSSNKVQNILKRLNSSSAMPALTFTDLKTLELSIPSFQEQKKISSFISYLERKIQTQQEKIDFLKEQKKGYMQKIFSQKLRFKDENGKDYPTWKKIRLGKLTKKTGKKNSEGLRYPVAAISNKKGFTLEGDRNYSNANVDIRTYKLVHKNEFAYNPARINVGSFGFQNVSDVAIVSSLYVIFKTLPSLSNTFLKAYMHSRYFNQDVIRNTEGSVREYLFYENFSNIKIPLPCLEEQDKIAEFLFKLELKTQLEEQKLESIQQQKSWFMQQMFI